MKLHEAPPLPRWIEAQFPFERKLAEVDGVRLHFVDQGEGPVVWLQHGNPMWSFLWRKVMAKLDGVRVIAPDLMGCGLSDKPVRSREHRLERHIELLGGLWDGLGLERVVCVGQDWGGPTLLGAARRRDVAGLVLANTSVTAPKRPLRGKAFHRFSQLPLVSDVVFRGGFPLYSLHQVQGEASSIRGEVAKAYRWPLKWPWRRGAPLGMARMVPDRESHPSVPELDGLGAWLEQYEGPAALVWGERDPILGRLLTRHHRALPQASVRRSDAGHFLQEEVPDLLVQAIEEVIHKAGLR